MESEKVIAQFAQTAQDYMEQHHGVCLKASEWDAFSKAAIAAFIEAGREPGDAVAMAGGEAIARADYVMLPYSRQAELCFAAMLDALMQEGK